MMAVRPSSTSSLITFSSFAFSSRAFLSCWLSVFTMARSKPVTWVPPLEVAMTLTNDLTVVL
jgi:hypothetical protein